MDLLERAKKLRKLGFFEGFEDQIDPKDLVREAREEVPELVDEGPATALLLAAGMVLEIESEAAEELSGYQRVLEEIAEFCENTFQVSDVRAEFVKGKSVSAGEEDEGRVVRLRFRLDGQSHEMEVTYFPDLIDLSFVSEIESHLGKIGERRRLCPIVEVVDDTARFVFIEPKKMELAEEQEVISAPDFEE